MNDNRSHKCLSYSNLISNTISYVQLSSFILNFVINNKMCKYTKVLNQIVIYHSKGEYIQKKNKMNNIVKMGGIYKHKKGKLYQILYIAKHSETLEDLVIYRALYNECQIWARPLSMFTEEGRFTLLKDEYRYNMIELSKYIIKITIDNRYSINNVELNFIMQYLYEWFKKYLNIQLFDNYITEKIPGHNIPLIASLYYHYCSHGIMSFYSYEYNTEDYEDDIIITIMKELALLNFSEINNKLLQLKGEK